MNFNPESYIRPSAYITPEGAIPDKIDSTGFANNLSALMNPQGTLETKQNQQIASSISNLQMSSAYPEIQNKYLEARTKYMEDYKNTLKSHKGMGRNRLTPQEELDFSNRRQQLTEMTHWGKMATSTIDKVNQDAINLIGQDKLDIQDYQNWWNQYMDKIKNAKTPADIPSAYPDFLNYSKLHPKAPKPAKPEDLIKETKEFEVPIIDTQKYKNRTKPVTPEMAAQDITEQVPIGSPDWQRYRGMYEARGFVKPEDDDQTALAKIAKKVAPSIKFSREQAPTTVNINQPTQTPEGETYKPMTGNEGVKEITVNGQTIRGKWGAYNRTKGTVTIIPETKVLKAALQENVDAYNRRIDQYKADDKMSKTDKEKSIAKYQAKIDAINKDPKSFERDTDEENAVEYKVKNVTGWENVYKQSKSKGNQDITPKNIEKKKIPNTHGI